MYTYTPDYHEPIEVMKSMEMPLALCAAICTALLQEGHALAFLSMQWLCNGVEGEGWCCACLAHKSVVCVVNV